METGRGIVVQIDKSRIVHEEIDGEVIAIDLATGAYFSMQGTAAAVWRLLAGGSMGEKQIVEAVLEFCESVPRGAKDEVAGFIAQLRDHELVSDTVGRTSSVSLPSGEAGPYSTPVIEKYTDMEELILLDPVHEVDSLGWPTPELSQPGDGDSLNP